jgi:hypothetical protein
MLTGAEFETERLLETTAPVMTLEGTAAKFADILAGIW